MRVTQLLRRRLKKSGNTIDFTSDIISRSESIDGNAPVPVGTMRSSSGENSESRVMLRESISSGDEGFMSVYYG
jgi:hypothetical protein